MFVERVVSKYTHSFARRNYNFNQLKLVKKKKEKEVNLRRNISNSFVTCVSPVRITIILHHTICTSPYGESINGSKFF